MKSKELPKGSNVKYYGIVVRAKMRGGSRFGSAVQVHKTRDYKDFEAARDAARVYLIRRFGFRAALGMLLSHEYAIKVGYHIGEPQGGSFTLAEFFGRSDVENG